MLEYLRRYLSAETPLPGEKEAEGMTYEEIAVKEKCKHPAVVKSVKAALDKLKNILEE